MVGKKEAKSLVSSNGDPVMDVLVRYRSGSCASIVFEDRMSFNDYANIFFYNCNYVYFPRSIGLVGKCIHRGIVLVVDAFAFWYEVA